MKCSTCRPMTSRLQTSVRALSLSSFLIDNILTCYSAIALGIVRLDRDMWSEANRGLSSLVKDVKVTALNIAGSPNPNQLGVLENVMSFTLKIDPPEEVKPHFPPGIRKGDTASMIRTSIISWDDEGKVTRDLEYGRLTWPDFDIDEFTAWK